jgi:hypothetical protein
MPNPNDRYPLVAIPKCFFEALQRDIEEDHDNPYEMASVNQYVQTMLNHTPMFDYLLKVTEFSDSGEEHYTRLVGDPSLRTGLLHMELVKVRVTKDQFDLLSQRQAQYASDGLRIPISCIVSSMLYQWSKSIRAVFRVQGTFGISKHTISCEAWMYGDVKGTPCQRHFFEKESGEWQSFFFKDEDDRVEPNVIVGWNPRKRALRGANSR